jgi:SAM-dependent methyltransferase
MGELLLRLLATEPTAHGTGVDNDDEAIARARGNATARGLDPRVRWHADEVAGWRDAQVDVVLAVGVSHIWGGTASMLSALTDRVKPGGRVLVGDAFWERPLTTRERVGLGVDLAELTTVSSLAEIVDTAIDRGYRLLAVSTATLDEWDDFESRYLRRAGTVAPRPSGRRPREGGPRHRRRAPRQLAPRLPWRARVRLPHARSTAGTGPGLVRCRSSSLTVGSEPRCV